jgi:predicted  nucleic acid-binding Zn-ribbon protein|tara:strand:- start:28438 stop:28635 length:198 start_codon:yes stop_codon:yes gene_type:complete
MKQEKEQEQLKEEKNKLEEESKSIGKDINLTQNEETELREKISGLVDKEVHLNNKKLKLMKSYYS